MAGIGGIDDVRQVQRQILRFVLSCGPVSEIEHDTSYESEKQASDKSGGKAQRSDVAVVQEGQQNGGDHGYGEGQHVALQINRFAWLTLHVQQIPSSQVDSPSSLASPSLGRAPMLVYVRPLSEALLILQPL